MFAGLILPATAQQGKYTGLKLRAIGEADFVYEFSVNPGETISGRFIAQHDFQDNEAQKVYYVVASDFSVDPETGDISYPANYFYENSKYSIARKLKFNTDRIVLNKFGDEQIIEFSATVPADAKGGTYYSAIVLSNLTPEQYRDGGIDLGNTSGAGVGSRIAPVVIVNVKGDNTVTGEISDLEILNLNGESPFLDVHEYLPVGIKTSFRNTGNYAINPTGNLFIHQGDISNPVATFSFNEGRNRVLPESVRPYFNEWSDATINFVRDSRFPGGGRLTLTENGEGIKFGKYYATAKILYKDNENQLKVTEMTTEFWVLPWKAMIVILAILIIIGVLIRKRSRAKATFKTVK